MSRQWRYDREHTRQYNLKLNKRTDADVIAYLDACPNIQGLVKSLVRGMIAGEIPKIHVQSPR